MSMRLIGFAFLALLGASDHAAAQERAVVEPAQRAAEPASPATPAPATVERPATRKSGTVIAEPNAQPAAPPRLVEEKPVSAKRRLSIGGRELAYTATLASMLLKSDEPKDGAAQGEKPRARVVFTSYTLDDAKPADRPIIFAWNGGPGSASFYLHVGFMGPKRAILTDDGRSPPPPGGLVTNDETLLRFADLVFIDPVGTGFSRVAPGEKSDRFYDTAADVEQVADLVQDYVTRNGRWESPKFLAGESYGAMRLAKAANVLQRNRGMLLNGLIVISGAMNYQVLSLVPGNDTPYPLFLPSYAAAAWYHKKVTPAHQGKPLRQFLDEVETFARGDYQSMLFKGALATPEERASVRKRLADMTGLSETYLDEAALRPKPGAFFKQLLRAERKIIGRYDSRITAAEPDPTAATFAPFDPTDAQIVGPYRTAIEMVWRDEIGYRGDSTYNLSAPSRGQWNFDAKNRYLDGMPDLQQAMLYNGSLKLFVAEGYFDLATAYAGVDYLLDHMIDPDGSIKTRTSVKRYGGGHMLYTVTSERQALSSDLGAFISSAVKR